MCIKKPPEGGFQFVLRTFHFAGTKAPSADVLSLGLTVENNTDTLNIRFPGSFRFQMRVADVHTGLHTFTTNFAIICHYLHLLASSVISNSSILSQLHSVVKENIESERRHERAFKFIVNKVAYGLRLLSLIHI